MLYNVRLNTIVVKVLVLNFLLCHKDVVRQKMKFGELITIAHAMD